MTNQIATPMVEHFGNSVLFGNHVDQLPVIFQPLLVYPDWFFLDWPYQLIMAYSNHAHPYYEGMGPAVPAFGFFFFIIGAILALNADDGMVKDCMTIRHVPISPDMIDRVQQKGVLAQLLVLPLVIVNLVYITIYKVVCIALYWHIAIAAILSAIISLGGKVGYQLTIVIEKVILFLMILAPLVTIIIRTFSLL